MADIQKTIEILFSGNDVDFTRTARNVGRSIDRLSTNVGSVTGPMAGMTTSLLQAEGALVGMGAAMAGVAINQAGQFRESVVEIGTLFNGTGEQVGQLQDQILEYSRNSTSSIEDINEAVYLAISTGTDWADAVKYVSDIEVLATAGRESLAATTDVLAGSMNAYGAATDEAADYSDVLMVAIQKGKTSLPELASALSKVTSDAASAKVPFADLNAAIAAITVTGVGTSEAMTKIRALLTELARPSDDLQAALNGVTLESDGLDGVMRQLLEATGGTSEEMNRLFGSTEAVSAATILANDSAGKYADALQAMEERTGAALTASERFSREFSDINQTLLNRIQAMFVDAGMPILGTYGDVVDQLGQIFNGVSFSIEDGAFKEIYDSIDQGGERLTNLLMGIAEALPDALENIKFDVLLDAFDRLNSEMGDLFGELDLTKPEDLERAIQALVNGVAALTNYSAAAVDALGPFIRGLADLVDKANDGESSLIDLVGNVTGVATAINAMLPALGLLADGIILLAGARALGKAVPSFETFTNVARTAGTVLPVLVNPVTTLAAGLAVLALNFNEVVTMVEEYVSGLLELETRAQRSTQETEALAAMFERNRKAMDDNKEAINKTAEEIWGVKTAQDGWTDSIDESAQALNGGSEALTDYQKLAAETDEMQRDFAERTEERAKQQAEAQEQYKNSILATIDKYGDLTKAEWDLLDVVERQEYTEARRVANKEGWIAATEEAVSALEEEANALEREERLREEAADQLFQHTQQANEFALAWEKIRSDERTAQFAMSVDLEVASLEAEAERAQAIITGIGDSITSTGETLSNLSGLLGGFGSTSASGYDDMLEIVNAEERRRDSALDMQRELTAAQVEQMEAQALMLRARAEAFQRGDAAITVNGEGLQPHLEAFMWEILETIQVRVNTEGHAMLLGV